MYKKEVYVAHSSGGLGGMVLGSTEDLTLGKITKIWGHIWEEKITSGDRKPEVLETRLSVV